MSTAPIEPSARIPIRHTVHALHECRLVGATVTVAGDDLNGIAFVDECSTVAIGPDGAIVTIARVLGPEQEVFLRHLNREVVAHVIGHSRGGHYGLHLDKTDPEFWGDLIAPPAPPDPLLIANYEQFEQAAPPQSPQPRGIERRRSKRIKMRQAKACIVQLPGGEQDVVELRDVSGGGLCFRSGRFYPLDAYIRVAARFTPESNNLLVRARIVRISRDSFGQDDGAEYVR